MIKSAFCPQIIADIIGFNGLYGWTQGTYANLVYGLYLWLYLNTKITRVVRTFIRQGGSGELGWCPRKSISDELCNGCTWCILRVRENAKFNEGAKQKQKNSFTTVNSLYISFMPLICLQFLNSVLSLYSYIIYVL